MTKLAKLSLSLFFIIVINSACSNGSDEILENPTTESSSEGTKTTTTSNVVFEDNFNTDGVPDKNKWVLTDPSPTSAWGKYFSGSYDQAYVKNGVLVLKAEKVNGVYKAAAIRSQWKFEFMYGKVEARARIKSAKGGWAAIWMWPAQQPKFINDGELDIMEQVNNETKVYQTLHSYYTYVLKHTDPLNQFTAAYNVNEFNTYAVDWTPEKISFYVNNKLTFTYPNLHLADENNLRQWPFNKMFYLFLDYTLGDVGTWPNGIDDSQLPGYMEIDWIKVTQAE